MGQIIKCSAYKQALLNCFRELNKFNLEMKIKKSLSQSTQFMLVLVYFICSIYNKFTSSFKLLTKNFNYHNYNTCY